MADSKGFKTDLKSTDPETGQFTWSVEYTANYGELFKEVSELLDDAKAVALKSKGEPFFQDYYKDVRNLKNRLRTYLRNNYPEEYANMVGIDEMSTSGDSGAYLTPKAFNPNKKAKGTASNYYYKLGFKPVPPPHSTKGVDIKYLWGKK
tara:strand:- start:414 stop:860 length:447 start_codon:yes stop_codon:yes gene_type:complete